MARGWSGEAKTKSSIFVLENQTKEPIYSLLKRILVANMGKVWSDGQATK